MADAGDSNIECGFCLKKNEALVDPKSLPCKHVHCYRCLVDSCDINGIVKCPFCR